MNHALFNSLRNFGKNFLFCVKLMLSCLAWYTAIYWVADSRYNRELARLEARVTNIITRLEGSNWRKAIEDVPILQRTLVPNEPLFFDFISVYISLNSAYDVYDNQVSIELSKMLIAHKEELDNLNLQRSIVGVLKKENIDFSGGNLSNSDLSYANLSEVRYSATNLKNTNFFKSDMSYSHFINSDLSNAYLSEAVVSNSFFHGVKLNNTNFYCADLKYSYLLGLDFSKSLHLNAANLQYAFYNSKEVTKEDLDLAYFFGNYNNQYCKYRNLDKCFSINFNLTSASKTLFPADFSPKAHNMIDLSDFIDYIKSQKNHSND